MTASDQLHTPVDLTSRKESQYINSSNNWRQTFDSKQKETTFPSQRAQSGCGANRVPYPVRTRQSKSKLQF
jgi:hypothetical protein